MATGNPVTPQWPLTLANPVGQSLEGESRRGGRFTAPRLLPLTHVPSCLQELGGASPPLYRGENSGYQLQCLSPSLLPELTLRPRLPALPRRGCVSGVQEGWELWMEGMGWGLPKPWGTNSRALGAWTPGLGLLDCCSAPLPVPSIPGQPGQPGGACEYIQIHPLAGWWGHGGLEGRAECSQPVRDRKSVV